MRDKIRREELAYVFDLDLGLDLDVWVHAEGEALDRRVLTSPDVDLRREGHSSVTHVSSFGFFNADGVPFFFKIQKMQTHLSHQWRSLASGPWLAAENHAQKKKK